LPALLWGKALKLGGHNCEGLWVGYKFVESDVGGSNQPQFFEARIREPPTSTLICPNTMRKDACKSPLRFNQANSNHLRARQPLRPPRLVYRGESES
jgi:hypothetical protein